MANQTVIEYLKDNKEKYPLETLYQELVKAGYPKKIIQEGMAEVYGKSLFTHDENFWDRFKKEKIYISAGQKVGHFFIGLFVIRFLVGLSFSFINNILIDELAPTYYGYYAYANILGALALDILVFLYLLKYRRWMGWGFLTSTIITKIRYLFYFIPGFYF